MTNEEMAVKIEEVNQRSRSNTHRIDTLEKNQEALNSIATSVAVMATEQKNISGKLDKVSSKVDTLERVPAKRWEFVVERIIYVVVAAVAGFILAKVGL